MNEINIYHSASKNTKIAKYKHEKMHFSYSKQKEVYY